MCVHTGSTVIICEKQLPDFMARGTRNCCMLCVCVFYYKSGCTEDNAHVEFWIDRQVSDVYDFTPEYYTSILTCIYVCELIR